MALELCALFRDRFSFLCFFFIQIFELKNCLSQHLKIFLWSKMILGTVGAFFKGLLFRCLFVIFFFILNWINRFDLVSCLFSLNQLNAGVSDHFKTLCSFSLISLVFDQSSLERCFYSFFYFFSLFFCFSISNSLLLSDEFRWRTPK